MSRYVDLDGRTWDGTLITSKIQEVQTKHGYMSGITVGWLWGDNVPHINIEEHDARIRADAIDEFCKVLCSNDALADFMKDYIIEKSNELKRGLDDRPDISTVRTGKGCSTFNGIN